LFSSDHKKRTLLSRVTSTTIWVGGRKVQKIKINKWATVGKGLQYIRDWFIHSFITKDCCSIQESYYISVRVNTMQFTRAWWVVQVLQLLHTYRTDLWHMWNSSLHVGHTPNTCCYGLKEQISPMILFKTLLVSPVWNKHDLWHGQWLAV
jgi:hypothetical protein